MCLLRRAGRLVTPAPRWRLSLTLLLTLASPSVARARDEGILELHADVTVHADASVTVDDTVLVWVTGQRIKHGFSWELATHYRDRLGDRHAVALDVVQVTRDGEPERVAVEELGDGQRLRVGSPAVWLEPGTHVYVISYRTERQIGFLADHDQLYAPIVSDRRELAITQAAVVVHPPEGVARGIAQLSGFVLGRGRGGDGASDRSGAPALAGERRGLDAVLTVTRPLAVDQGLAILATWPKGAVREPPVAQRLSEAAGENRGLVFAALALLAQAGFFLSGNRASARPPLASSPPAAVVAGAPPDGLSPAALRYVVQRRVDGTALAAGLLGLAGAGRLSLTRGRDDVFVIARGAAGGSAAAEEAALTEGLFRGGETLRLEAETAGAWSAARRALRAALRAQLGDRYWTRDRRFSAPGLTLSVVAALALIAGARAWGAGLGTALAVTALLVSSVAVVGALTGSARAWGRAARRDYAPEATKRALARSLIALLLLAAWLSGLVWLALNVTVAAALLVAASGLLDYGLLRLPPVATPAGRAVIDGALAYRASLAAPPAAGAAVTIGQGVPGGAGVVAAGPRLAYAVALDATDAARDAPALAFALAVESLLRR
jgi:hypothetical protein